MDRRTKRYLAAAVLLLFTVLVTALLRVSVPLGATGGGRDAGVYVTLGDACAFLAGLLLGCLLYTSPSPRDRG